MKITKTFTGSKKAIESVTGYSFDSKTTSATKNHFYINVNGGETDIRLYPQEDILYCTNLSHKHEDIKCYSQSVTCEDKTDANKKTYMLTYTWVVDIKYGINYTISENNYTITDYLVNSVNNIVDPQQTQSKGSTTSSTANIIGVHNYVIDNPEALDTSKILTVNFRNTYAPTSAITIQKVDFATKDGLSNAKFSLYKLDENGNYDESQPLKFIYKDSTYIYDETNSDESVSVLVSLASGSIIIDKLPTQQSYKLIETSVPEGYDRNSSVVVTLTPDKSEEGVIVPVISMGTGKDYDEINKVLEVDNASELTTVSVEKDWNEILNKVADSEKYVKDVKVVLCLNGLPISQYNLKTSIQEQVTLNESNGWKYKWTDVPLYVNGKKAVYSVREVQIGDIQAVSTGKYIYDDATNTGYWESDDAFTQYRAHTTTQTESVEKNIDENGNEVTITDISFNLINEIHFVKIKINKINSIGIPIDNVTFELYRIDDSGKEVFVTSAVTSETGQISFKDLEYSTKYILKETVANKNYYLNETPIYLKIQKGAQADQDILVLYEDSDYKTQATPSEETSNYYEYVSLNNDQDTLNIINISHTEMPKAGGCGVYRFYILGIFLMGCSTIIIYLRKNKIKKGM